MLYMEFCPNYMVHFMQVKRKKCSNATIYGVAAYKVEIKAMQYAHTNTHMHDNSMYVNLLTILAY